MYRILIVDDEVKICEFIQACLDNEGMKHRLLIQERMLFIIFKR